MNGRPAFVPLVWQLLFCIASELPTSHAWPPVQAFHDEHAEEAHRGMGAEEDPDSPHAQHHQAGELALHERNQDVWQALHAQAAQHGIQRASCSLMITAQHSRVCKSVGWHPHVSLWIR